MMNTNKAIRVAVLTHLSNSEIRSRLPLEMCRFEKMLRKICGKSTDVFISDFAVWNTNLIEEIKAYSDEIKMHIISPYPYLKVDKFEYEEDGVYFHFFKDKSSTFLKKSATKIRGRQVATDYNANRQIIAKTIASVRPDILHIIGIENPYYAIAGTDCPNDVPLMLQLQTLMIDPAFKRNYPISESEYLHRSSIEKLLLEKAAYICTPIQHFIDIINKDVKHHAHFINTTLPLAEPIYAQEDGDKKFDFVYFSADINKAADLAIEGYILACKTIPGLTMDIIGDYCDEFKNQLSRRLEKAGLSKQVTFEGKLPSHEDVLRQIRKSRFALLPLKIDFISGTIRESFANGLPVVSTITEGTPTVNSKKETILISPIGDHQALADNMVKLYNNPSLAKTLRNNGIEYMTKNFSNKVIVGKWVKAYKAVMEKKMNGTPIPEDLLG